MTYLIGGQIIRTLNNDKGFLGRSNYPELKESDEVTTEKGERNEPDPSSLWHLRNK